MGISKDLTLFGWIQANTYNFISNASIPSIKLLLYRSVKTKCLKPIPVYELEPAYRAPKAYTNFKGEGRL